MEMDHTGYKTELDPNETQPLTPARAGGTHVPTRGQPQSLKGDYLMGEYIGTPGCDASPGLCGQQLTSGKGCSGSGVAENRPITLARQTLPPSGEKGG